MRIIIVVEIRGKGIKVGEEIEEEDGDEKEEKEKKIMVTKGKRR